MFSLICSLAPPVFATTTCICPEEPKSEASSSAALQEATLSVATLTLLTLLTLLLPVTGWQSPHLPRRTITMETEGDATHIWRREDEEGGRADWTEVRMERN